MTEVEPKSILKSHNLRVTDCRMDVVNHFVLRKSALSLGDLEDQFKQYDRVTLYRTLISFLESGIIHKIPNDTGFATYGLCHDTCTPDKHSHNHIHFKCKSCGQIECIDEQITQKITLPKGYQVDGVNLIADGICAECA